MIKSIAARLSILFLLIAITTCYYERDINEELEICYVRSGEIWIMNIDGSNQHPITFNGPNSSPSWSPDGKRILFERADSGNTIYIINSDRTNLKQLSHTESFYPTWSADGDKIYYYEINGTHSIVYAKLDGTIISRYPLTAPISSFSPSPDGKNIYYSTGSALRKIDIEKGSDDYITNNPSYISISPDGNKIAYINGTDIHIYNIENDTGIFLVANGSSPSWTPDGKTIIYTSATTSEIYKINIDGSNQKKLTSSNGFCHSPCVKWKPK